MGSKPRSREEYVSRLVIDKQRAIYWLCSLLERDSPAVRDGARKALATLGYDERRIGSMLLLGEPGLRGAGEGGPAAFRTQDQAERARAAAGGAARCRGTAAGPCGRLTANGRPGTG